MELNWLEDFVQLARSRNFSRAAGERNISQSAFSRRIRALEHWLGALLINRGSYPVSLTEAGEEFLPTAVGLVGQLYDSRVAFRQTQKAGERTVTLAAQRSLSLGFFTGWIEDVERRIGTIDIRMIADNHYGAIQSLNRGGCDFLLCFTHPDIESMSKRIFPGVLLGDDRLIPISAPNGANPQFALPGKASSPIPYLSYGSETFLGKAVNLIVRRHRCALEYSSYEAAFGEALKSMALSGRGVAWLPEHSIKEELAAGKLIPAGGEKWSARLDIRLFRAGDSLTPIGELLWKTALTLSAENNYS